MRAIWIIVFFSVVQLNVLGQCNVEQRVFRAGEEITYKAFYNWNFIWLEAADVKFTVKDYPEQNAFKLISIGNSLPKYDWFYMVRDTFRSHIHKQTLKPFYYHRNTREGSYRVNNRYRLNWQKKLAYTDTKNSEFGNIKDTLKLPDCTFDVLSAIYFTRSMSFNNKSVGEKIPLTFIIDNEIYELYIRYLGKETLTTRVGDRYKCIKFSILLVEGTIFSGGEEMTVWATDDKNHMPVQVEAKIMVGSVKAVLTSYENIKYPNEAKLDNSENKD